MLVLVWVLVVLVLVLVMEVVNGYIILKEKLLSEGADLSDFCSLIFVCKICVFVSRPMKIVTFLR